jgi:formimidoylglutamate deiminase
MYRAALGLSPDDIFEVSRFCFLEMMRAGITTVGEFHYLHRDPAGERYDARGELARRVLDAAQAVGIRICLLNVAYATGGIGRPLGADQRRFATPDLEEYLTETVELADAAQLRPAASVGLAPHSLRAVPRDWLRPIHTLAFGYDAPMHIHASEQPAEVAACQAAYRRRPIEVLADEGVLDGSLTAVHATHLSFREVELLGLSGATVCLCPTTERDLGDGFPPTEELVAHGAQLALGTDSQTLIDLLEEMRLLEYNERLRKLRRVVLADAFKRGAAHRNGARAPTDPSELPGLGAFLIRAATTAGARSLRVPVGSIEPGLQADLVALDLSHHALDGWTLETLPDCIALCAPTDVVTDVWVNGARRVIDRWHPLAEEAAAAFRGVAARVH